MIQRRRCTLVCAAKTVIVYPKKVCLVEREGGILRSDLLRNFCCIFVKRVLGIEDVWESAGRTGICVDTAYELKPHRYFSVSQVNKKQKTNQKQTKTNKKHNTKKKKEYIFLSLEASKHDSVKINHGAICLQMTPFSTWHQIRCARISEAR